MDPKKGEGKIQGREDINEKTGESWWLQKEG